MDLDVDDNYKVEHGDDFDLTKEQFRKLIESKVKRYQHVVQQRESEHESVD
jgi:hypothetical protein